MIKLDLTQFERLTLYELVGIDDAQQKPKQYPIGQLDDASVILKKMVSEGVPFMGKVSFSDGEVELERSEFTLLKALFEAKQEWSVDKGDIRKSLKEKLEVS